MRSFCLGLLLCAAASAKASTYTFNYTGSSPNGTNTTLTFTEPSSPVPLDPALNEFLVDVNSGTLNGLPLFSTVAFVGVGGGLYLNGGAGSNNPPYEEFFFSLGTPQLFTGDVFHPTFTLGTYTVSGTLETLIFNTASDTKEATSGTLSITTTPEPSGMLLLGTGLLAGAGRIKRRFA